MARDALAKHGYRIAFGDSNQIIWDHNSEIIFRNNPNVAPPGDEDKGPLHWIKYYRGHRQYNHQIGDKWVWNYEFKPQRGEVFLTPEERRAGELQGKGYVIIEPNVPHWKRHAINKQWPIDRWERVAKWLFKAGYDVRQFDYGGASYRCSRARPIPCNDFRVALAIMERAVLYIGPEGGLHHGAAAVGVPAVVIFGGFIPPAVTGYEIHTNLTGGSIACGHLFKCEHCKAALEAISAEEVHTAALGYLNNGQQV